MQDQMFKEESIVIDCGLLIQCTDMQSPCASARMYSNLKELRNGKWYLLSCETQKSAWGN